MGLFSMKKPARPERIQQTTQSAESRRKYGPDPTYPLVGEFRIVQQSKKYVDELESLYAQKPRGKRAWSGIGKLTIQGSTLLVVFQGVEIGYIHKHEQYAPIFEAFESGRKEYRLAISEDNGGLKLCIFCPLYS